MRYTETKEASAEILRVTLPLMAQHEVAYHPQTYAVFYEYVAGINPRLSRELDQRIAKESPLTDDDIRRLHTNFVVTRDAEALERMQQRVLALLSDTAAAAANAEVEATQFNETLEIHKKQLVQPPALDLLANLVAELISDTERMRIVTHELSEQLERATQEARHLSEQLRQAEHQAKVDPLTGMLNRRGMEHRIQTVLQDTGSLHGSVMLLADIDNFKLLNDKYGHLLGDKVIRSVAQLIGESIKGRDIAARIGGEEFAILLPGTTIEGAMTLANRISTATSSRSIRRSGGTDVRIERVTVSIGVAPAMASDSLDELLERADKAMYASKQSGRNRVTLWDQANNR